MANKQILTTCSSIDTKIFLILVDLTRPIFVRDNTSKNMLENTITNKLIPIADIVAYM